MHKKKLKNSKNDVEKKSEALSNNVGATEKLTMKVTFAFKKEFLKVFKIVMKNYNDIFFLAEKNLNEINQKNMEILNIFSSTRTLKNMRLEKLNTNCSSAFNNALMKIENLSSLGLNELQLLKNELKQCKNKE